MSEKRYTAEETGGCGAWRVMVEDHGRGDETEVCFCHGDPDPRTDDPRRDARDDAERIARLLNAEDRVRAALREANSYIQHIYESGDRGRIDGVTVASPVGTLARVRSALSALDGGA